MTRIIAGFAGSRELRVPKSGTRPTSDRVREAIFSALEARDVIVGSRVLDLFAGSGALGLEALSRGAASVVLVEKNAGACAVARHNATMVCGAGNLSADQARVVNSSVDSYLASTAEEADLVFIDPPYDMTDDEVNETLVALTRLLTDSAVVVIERSSRSGAPIAPTGTLLEKSKAYGETTLHWVVRS